MDQTPPLPAHRLAVAPMLDWTDRNCRIFHRLLSRRTTLYTEMVTAPAILHGNRARLLDHAPTEGPVVLQLGGADPAQLATAAQIGADHGFDGINLNCGCPSDRVRSGAFGAVLMRDPDLVAECCAAMIAAQPLPVTAKCRIGVDDQDPAAVLPPFIARVAAAGVGHFIIHARKAWLQGLSPRENREIPPLDHPLVVAIKREFPQLTISINGGIASHDQAAALLDQGLDGVMIGRAAYHDPAAILLRADSTFWGVADPLPDALAAAQAMRMPIARHLTAGGRLHQMTRHMLGLFAGRPGARRWRQILSSDGTAPGAGLAEYDAALAAVTQSAA